jgi:hypothetical protein
MEYQITDKIPCWSDDKAIYVKHNESKPPEDWEVKFTAVALLPTMVYIRDYLHKPLTLSNIIKFGKCSKKRLLKDIDELIAKGCLIESE